MASVSPVFYEAMRYRSIGPFRGGRVLAVAGDPVDQATFYFGACSGGLWKTTDAGVFWRNISDGYFKTASVGAIAVSDSDPNVIYAGMGEACIRSNVTHGDGVYKSTDGGKTWVHLGLEDTRHIARVRIHPKDPDLVYVAALGHAFGPNEARGVFRSKDGGTTWEKILYKSDKAGAVDLSMDPKNPRNLYAAMYQARRYPYTVVSGGPDSGLWKSTDGGDNWEEITKNPGLPETPLGRIGVAVSPAKPGRVWALVEHEKGGLFRSDDDGATWALTSDDVNLRRRHFYYTHVFAHPTNPDTCYVLSGRNWKSTDGGRNFTRFTTPHDDDHDMWIDPKNPKRIIHANDEGASISFNDGFSWTRLENQPTGQFYHVTTDTNFPYRVYGTQQDGSSITIPSRSATGAITQPDWYSVGGGEAGYVAVRPDDPNIVYAAHSGGGPLSRYDHKTGQGLDIKVWPERSSNLQPWDLKYRFQWTFPIVISPHNPNVLYVTGNNVFRSTSEGASWDAISPDLTRNDVRKAAASDGPPVEGLPPCTIFAFDESKVQKGVLWAGSDDGLVHVSRDDGENWANVTPKELPEWSMVSIIEPSPHDAATAYVAATAYKLDDTAPYLFKTSDYGRTWQRITNGIPDHDFTRVIREDPARQGLLYAGTETSIYVSFDDGANWQSLQLNLPVVPIHDFVIKDNDLVVATHGRAFWVLDDVTPLHQITDEVLGSTAHLFKPRSGYRFPMWRPLRPDSASLEGVNYDRGAGPVIFSWYAEKDHKGDTNQVFLDAGQNPPDGVVIFYYLKDRPESEVELTIIDAEDNEITRFQSKEEGSDGKGPFVGKDSGMNRFLWDMRHKGAETVPGDETVGGLDESLAGPLATPGIYRVRLSVNDTVFTQPFEVKKNPLNSSSKEDLAAQFRLLVGIRDNASGVSLGVIQLRDIRDQVDRWMDQAQGKEHGERISGAAKDIKDRLTQIESELVHVSDKKAPTMDGPVRLYSKLAALNSVVSSADYAPTAQMTEVYEDIAAHVDTQLQLLNKVIAEDVISFNKLVSELGWSPIDLG